MLIASFASPDEAYRYAVLIREPAFTPQLRQRMDGEILPLDAEKSGAETIR
jgi:hypothetical protein